MTSLAPRTLTDEQRAVRVEVVRDQVELMKRYGAATGDRQHARWLLKEVIYRVWEQPQIPPPRIGKYSLWFRWSPRARERLADCKPGGPRPDINGLRFEHLIPRGILAEELLEAVPDDLAAFLDRHFVAAVITTQDDAQLNSAGVRTRMPGDWSLGDDPWLRYKAAGFTPSEFVVPCEVQPELRALVWPVAPAQ